MEAGIEAMLGCWDITRHNRHGTDEGGAGEGGEEKGGFERKATRAHG